MTDIELHRILLDSIKELKDDLRKNIDKTSLISDKVINIENALIRIESFKNGQILFNALMKTIIDFLGQQLVSTGIPKEQVDAILSEAISVKSYGVTNYENN